MVAHVRKDDGKSSNGSSDTTTALFPASNQSQSVRLLPASRARRAFSFPGSTAITPLDAFENANGHSRDPCAGPSLQTYQTAQRSLSITALLVLAKKNMRILRLPLNVEKFHRHSPGPE